MRLKRDALGRAELVGNVGDDIPMFSIPVNTKIDRETDDHGDYWVVFISRVGAAEGEFITFGARTARAAQDLANEYIAKRNLKVKSTVVTNAAKAKLGTPRLITNL